LTVERKTIATKMYSFLEELLSQPFPAAHLCVIIPLSHVEEVQESVVQRTRGSGSSRRTETCYGIRLRLSNRPALLLRLGTCISNRQENMRDIEDLQTSITSARASSLAAMASMQGTSAVEAGRGGGDPGGTCVICLEKVSRIAFAPCAHVCCCEDCGQDPALSSCPMCRRTISARIGLYFTS